VYQWFSGKAEILAVLHSLRFEEELERVSALPDDLDFPAMVESTLQGMATIWADTGHHRTTIIDQQSSADHETFIDGLTHSFRALSACIEQRLRQAADRDGLELRPAGELMPWLWAVCIGAGTQLIDSRFIGPRGPDGYLAGLVGPTAAGLVQPTSP
jgi:AcrR family transcriptional regulator